MEPEEAYRFARGEEVVATHCLPARLVRPLDFLVVADHAEGLGAMQMLMGGEPSEIALVLGHRIVGVYLSVSALFFVARSTTSVELITLLSTFAVIANGLLTALGLYEFLTNA